MPGSEQKPRVSFAADIAPIFAQRGADEMRWRFDLTNYDDVRANAEMIYGRISETDDGRMPPPRFPALTSKQISNFQWWMCNGFPR